jgi:hypothetical protein
LLVSTTQTVLKGDGPTDRARADGPRIQHIEIGIDGHFKVGRWTPIAVSLADDVAESVQLAVWVPDPDGNPTRQPAAEAFQPGTSEPRLRSVFCTGRMDGVVRVDLEVDGKVVESRTIRSSDPGSDAVRMLPPDTLDAEYWIVLGSADGYQQAADAINVQEGEPRLGATRPLHIIPLAEAAAIPTQTHGLDAVDVIAINGVHEIDEATQRAIRRWVEQGGHLVVSTSSREAWDRLGFSSWMPVQNVREVRVRDPVRDLDGLRSRFPRSGEFNPSGVTVLHFEQDVGERFAQTRSGPVWARVPVGFGRTTLLGLDLAQRPLAAWDALPQLCELLADYQHERTTSRPQRTTARLSRTGVSDLGTQLATAIDRFPHMEEITNWMAMGLIVLYLLVVGPLDYLLVHRVLRRPYLTWVTLPLIVVTSAALAMTSARKHHPQALTANQVDLIDVDAASGLARLTHWSSFVSPETRRWSVEAEFHPWQEKHTENSALQWSHINWLGIPESGFRGMYRKGGVELAKPRYRFAPGLASLEDVPLNIWSSLSVTARHIRQLPDGHATVESDLEGSVNQLYGTVTNRLDVPIEDWFIAHNNLAYFPKDDEDAGTDTSIAPGETIPLSHSSNRVRVLVLRNYLTGLRHIRVKKEGSTFESDAAVRASYDPLSRDFDAIFRAVSFYETIGGKEFTTLDNDALDELDLSPLLGLSRAVLFGRISGSPTSLLVDGNRVEPREATTFIRVLMPVRAR